MNGIEQVKGVDVVIIGAGFAGLAAGIQARLAGASVLLIEKMAAPGGNSIISDGGMNASGTRMQKDQGIDDSPEKMYQDMLKAGQGINHPELAWAVAENSAQILDWTMEYLGVKFRNKVGLFGGHGVARSHITQNVSGVDIIKPLVAKFKELGGELRLKTVMREIITRPNQGVAGVVLQEGFKLKTGPEGKEYRVIAKRGVILATGGFGADVGFRKRQDPRLDEKIDTTNKPSATAEGLIQMLKLGAAPVHLSHIQLGPWCSPDEPLFGSAPDFICYVSQGHGIWLEMSTARRFVNELSDRSERSDSILKMGKPALALADQSAVDSVGWDLSRSLAKGVVRRFDSLADLARHYDLGLAQLKSSVQRYNEMLAKGRDQDFNKPIPANALPIDTPPFYGARIWPKVHFTMGGVCIDAQARVLDLDGLPIQNLFAAGEVTGGVHGACRLGGNAITECLYFGRMAGSMAATGEGLS